MAVTDIGSGSADGNAYLTFTVPTCWSSTTKAVIVGWRGEAGVVRYEFNTEWGAPGASTASCSCSISQTNIASASKDLVMEIDATGALSGIAAGDIVGLQFTRRGAHACDTMNDGFEVAGFLLEYS